MDKDLTKFSISDLLDAIYMLRVSTLDSPEWKAKQAAAREKIVAELESRPAKDLVQSLIIEAMQ
jgi:hypothetical protein